jgi:hypothetical protein
MQRARERTAAAATSNDRRPILQAERARLSANAQTNKQNEQENMQANEQENMQANNQTSKRASKQASKQANKQENKQTHKPTKDAAPGGVQGSGPPVEFGCAGSHGSATKWGEPIVRR